MAAISTPCTKVCTIDATSGLCVGCGRTSDEIGRWLSLNEDERRQIMGELPARLHRVKGQAAVTATRS
jgi:predicted Fe-S protein YdhL (DUF1289 family)